MKKVLVSCIIVFIMLAMGTVYATDNTNTVAVEGTGELETIKDKTTQEIQDYVDRYGSDTYGLAAYVLDKVRIYSIPFCFVGIAIGAIYQYVIGIRRMDIRDKGFNVIIAFVTILIICQVLPLIFAIVVKGWRG